MKKIILLILAIIVFVVGGAFWFLTSDKLNDLIKDQIQVQGSKFTEQSVTVAKVDMQLLHGKGTINSLVLNNPKGYSAIPAFSLGEITLDINLQSLQGTPIVIDEVIINKPEALVEFNKSAGTNIQEILDAIDRNVPKSSSEQSNTDSTSKTQEPKIIVKKFVLAGVALSVDLTELGYKTYTQTLPDIIQTNVGGSTGLPASELGGALIKQALSAIWKEAKKSQKKIIEDKVKDKVKDKAQKEVNKLFKKFSGGI